MSMPYPQDRARAREEAGEQPFKDAKETFTEHEAQLEREAPVVDDAGDEAGTRAQQEERAEARLGEVIQEMADESKPS